MTAPVGTRINRLAAISPRTAAKNLQTDLTIGDFRLGADYLRDAANSFGLASTVTAGDDVRFWAGDTFANRATAPTRLTKGGVLTATSITTAATTATWAGVSGAGKPADNATVGATWGTDLSSIPANISTAGGSPAISLLNNAISLSAAGVLSGAGGGTIDLGSLSGSVTTGQLNANIVAAVQGAFANLAAIKADLGSVTAGQIVVGTTNKLWLNDGADGILAIGGTDKATAPFRVTAAGALTAASITTAQNTADAKLAKAGGDVLTGIIDVQQTTNYNAALRTGDIAWNTTTGAITGGSGVAMTRLGLVGAAAGVTTFSINATTGAALFAGELSAPTGALGGFSLGADYVRDAANSFGLASTVTGGDDVRFWAGAAFADRATAPLRLYESGDIYIGSGTFAGDVTTAGHVVASGSYNTAGVYAAITGSATTANGVYGIATSGNGVRGETENGAGVLGTASVSGGKGVYGQGSVSGTYGVYGSGNHAGAIGVIAYNNFGGTALKVLAGLALLSAGTTGNASVRIPHGSAPTSPTDGDMWTTTAGLYVRINGATVGPLT